MPMTANERIQELREALEEVKGLIAPFVDVIKDETTGKPKPNNAMTAQMIIDRTLAKRAG
jgi:hypothetical protein